MVTGSILHYISVKLGVKAAHHRDDTRRAPLRIITRRYLRDERSHRVTWSGLKIIGLHILSGITATPPTLLFLPIHLPIHLPHLLISSLGTLYLNR